MSETIIFQAISFSVIQRILKLACATGLLFSLNVWAEDMIWIDVRSAEEYSEDHLEQAVNIPHSEIAANIMSVTEDKNANIYLHCRSGKRAGMAKAELEKLGYTNVTNVGGLSDAKEYLQSLNEAAE